MAKIFSNTNPSQIYMDALISLLSEGDECAPRGKKIKELRPVIIEYKKPTTRVTFLKGRVINPFFQLAESLWILTGRSDVKWLLNYNSNMAQFSDDGKYFNAPYGERLRYWNKSDANGFILNPIDQLYDVYQKIKADNDTRQAVAVIYNPLFDNFSHETVDRPCNLILTFKLRHGKLDLNVFNRSNDLHWGTFGANLCQFSTILEVMANWLGVEVGTYYQTTDSLHIYLDDYGAKETDKVLKAYKKSDEGFASGYFEVPTVDEYLFKNEPRFSSNYEQFNKEMKLFFEILDPLISDMNTMGGMKWVSVREALVRVEDKYLSMCYLMMAAYRAHKVGNIKVMIDALNQTPDCSWKVSGLRFLSKRYSDVPEFHELYNMYPQGMQDYIERKEE